MRGRRPPLDEEKALFEATVAAEGVTTSAGEGTGLSLVDAGLAGSGANSFVSMMAVIHPGDKTQVDSKDITTFTDGDGTVRVASAFKGGQVAAGVPYKILTFRFVPAEVAALVAALAGVATDTDPRVMGKLQMAVASWDGRLGDGAGSDVLLTATGQAVVIKGVIVVMADTPDLTNDPWTGISVEDDYATTPHTFIAAADGVKTNLTANAQLAWSAEETGIYLAVGRGIQATAIGDDADEDALITVIVLYRAVVSGGYLA